MAYTPKRGDLVWTDFDPSAGHEQAHKRPAIVLSPEAFNGKLKLALVAPITSRVRGHGFEVALRDCTTQGAIFCQQVRTIDYVSRGVMYIEKAPTVVIDEVLAKVGLLVK
jgi:mRNA interferase MazF